jgi:hypothetical protein
MKTDLTMSQNRFFEFSICFCQKQKLKNGAFVRSINDFQIDFKNIFRFLILFLSELPDKMVATVETLPEVKWPKIKFLLGNSLKKWCPPEVATWGTLLETKWPKI